MRSGELLFTLLTYTRWDMAVIGWWLNFEKRKPHQTVWCFSSVCVCVLCCVRCTSNFNECEKVITQSQEHF